MIPFWITILDRFPLSGERRSVLGVHWKDWCWSWNSKTLATWCKELTHLQRVWCWEGLRAGGEGDDKGWDGWMVSPTQWTWVWVNSWWWIGRPGVLWFTGSQTVRYNWATELNWSGELRDPGFLHHAMPSQFLCFQLHQHQRISTWKIMRAIVWARPEVAVINPIIHFHWSYQTTWPHLAKWKTTGKYRGAHEYWCTVSAIVDFAFGVTVWILKQALQLDLLQFFFNFYFFYL